MLNIKSYKPLERNYCRKSERVPKVLKRLPKELTKIEEFIPRVGILTSLIREGVASQAIGH